MSGVIRPEPDEDRAEFIARLVDSAQPLDNSERDRLGALLRQR
jgi:hypothetical protein